MIKETCLVFICGSRLIICFWFRYSSCEVSDCYSLSQWALFFFFFFNLLYFNLLLFVLCFIQSLFVTFENTFQMLGILLFVILLVYLGSKITEPAFLVSLFSVILLPALMLLPQQTTAKKKYSKLTTTDWQVISIILLPMSKDIGFLANRGFSFRSCFQAFVGHPLHPVVDVDAQVLLLLVPG